MKLNKNIFAIKHYEKLIRLYNWLEQIPNKVTPAPFRLIRIGTAFWQSRALYVATKLEIADELSDSEKSTSELATNLSLQEDHLYRLMRMLASIGIFTETSPRVFAHSKMSECLRKDNPNNVRAMILMHNSTEMSRPWMDSLEESLRNGGIPFEKVHQADLFGYMDQNDGFDTLFSQAMECVERVAGTDFLQDFNWGAFNRILDIGGSRGSKSLSILKSNPDLTALVFDRLSIIEGAKQRWKGEVSASVLNRMEFVGGDLFESLPRAESDKDVYFFMAIFHTFDDTNCRKILRNLKTAIGDKSPCIVIADTVASEKSLDATTASMDLQMLMGTKGRERTRTEWENLFRGTGFYIEQVMDIRTFAKFIVVRRQ